MTGFNDFFNAGTTQAGGPGGYAGLMQNPMFNVGLSLLMANNAGPGNNNPFQAIAQGLLSTQKNQDMQRERDKLDEKKKNQDILRRKIQDVYQNMPQMQPQGMPPAAPQMQPQGMPPAAPQMQPQGMPPAAPQMQPQGMPPAAPQMQPQGMPPAAPQMQPQGMPPAAPQMQPQGMPPAAPQMQPQGDTFSTLESVENLMMQYGTPEQQQAVLSQMSARDRFKAQAAAEESRFTRANDLRRELAEKSKYNASLAEWEKFSRFDPETKKEYLKMKRGSTPTSTTEKRLYEYSDKAFKNQTNIQKYESLAKDILKIRPESGVVGKWYETVKKITGSQDAVTEIKKRWNEIRVSAAIANLPPGVASERDMELAMAAFLDENASPEAIASALRTLADLERWEGEYNDFAARYISSNPQRGAIGLNSAWKDYAKTLVEGQEDFQDAIDFVRSQNIGGSNEPGLSPEVENALKLYITPEGM